MLDRLHQKKPDALLAVGQFLQKRSFRFTTVTPATHARVLGHRSTTPAENITDIFGWSRPFFPDDFAPVAEMLESAGELQVTGTLARSGVRFSTLGEQLYVHSAYPTDAADSVFFGPDTYRFARVIRQYVQNGKNSPTRIIDLGCGTGAGGIYAASFVSGNRPELLLVDINEKALRYAALNCALNGAQDAASLLQSDLFDAVDGVADLIVSNPPYLIDAAARAYRHGGARGFDLSLRIAEESLNRLSPGGRMILYTGTPVIGGEDQFLAALSQLFATRSQQFSYEEVDPDVFGEELDNPNYSHVDRIAAVVVVAEKQE